MRWALRQIIPGLATVILMLGWRHVARAADPDSALVQKGTVPFSDEPDVSYEKKHIFPLLQEKLSHEHLRRLPPPYGVMLIGNWLQSDWRFDSAAISLGGSNPISLDAAANATMNLRISTKGVKPDLWLLPFLDVMVNFGDVDVDAELGLRDIPLDYDPVGGNYTNGDAIIPMTFGGRYYGFGIVPAFGWRHFYGAADITWIKTDLDGSADLSASGFWTFSAAPKVGYNAGLSQLYVGMRYISKNEHYAGTVDLPSGNPLGFDVKISTDSWSANAGMRTIIQGHWEVIMESGFGRRYQITGGVGYRW
jgi:hypothetical protein